MMAGTVLLHGRRSSPMPAGASLVVQADLDLRLHPCDPGAARWRRRCGAGASAGAGFAAFALISAIFGQAAAPPVIGVLSDVWDLRVALLVCMPTIFSGAVILLRARHHLDEDVVKVLMAVQRAYQEQRRSRKRAAEEARRTGTD